MTTADPVRDEIAALREARDRAYARLSDRARRAFDVACVTRVLPHFEARHTAGELLRALLVTDEGEALSAAVHAIACAAGDDHDGRVIHHVARAAIAAAAVYEHGLAASDFQPTSANDAMTARYLAACLDTHYDLDAADIAVRDELRRQTTHLDALLAEP